MSKINDIQNGILQLEGGRYQNLLDCYLYREYGYDNWSPHGSQLGTDKTTKGTPDTYIRNSNGKYILLMYGTVKDNTFKKVKEDITSCLDKDKTGIDVDDIEEIICCHTSSRFTPGQNKELHNLFSDVKLIGIGELSQSLFYKYQNLAKEFLSISVDTNQILDDNDFVAKYEASGFTTPLSNKLLCRNNEKSELIQLLNENNVIMISGKSGAGKTRIALEIAREYSKKHGLVLKCIKQNGEPIYEDLKSHFVDDNNYLVLVDDANQLAHLSHLLDICTDKERKHIFKILITVRDYAKEDTLHRIREKILPSVYDLKVLSDESMRSILKNEFNINSKFANQIIKVSSGNMRLAIMATFCAKNGKLPYLNNLIDIYDFYYQETLKKMDKKMLITAALFAFFDSLRLDVNDHLIYDIAERQRIDRNGIQEISLSLHTLEVVDIYNNLALKFSDQGLGNYLLYLVLYKEKWLSIHNLISMCFPKYRGRIIYACNTLLSMFYSIELHEYALNEMKIAWQDFKNADISIRYEFISAFHEAIEDETLLFIKQEIDKLPEYHEDFLKYDFKSKSNYQNIKSKIIKIIASLKISDKFSNAIELLIKYIDKNTEHPMDFYFLLKSNLSIDSDSYDFNYEKETLLLDQLWEHYKQDEDSNIAVLLIYLCGWLLKFEFESTEYTSNRSIVFQRFGIADCDSIRELRDKCITILFSLYNKDIDTYGDRVLRKLSSYHVLDNYETVLSIATKDLIKFDEMIKNMFSMESVNECLVVQHLNSEKSRNELLDESYLTQYSKNDAYKIYCRIKRNRYEWMHEDNYEERYKAQIEQIAESISLEELDICFKLAKNDKFSENWDMSEGLYTLFNSLNQDIFLNAVDLYIKYDTPFNVNTYVIISRLIKQIGYHECWKYIEDKVFTQKFIWLTSLIDKVEGDDINMEFANKVILFIKENANNSNFNPPMLDVVLRINEKCKGFAIQYLSLLLNKFSDTPYIISNFLNIHFIKKIEIDKLITVFNYPQNTILEDAYLVAYGTKHFDYKHDLILSILNANGNFLKRLISVIIDENNHDRILVSLWSLENYSEMVETAINLINGNRKTIFSANKIIKSIFSHEEKEDDLIKKQDGWLEKFISKNYHDKEMIKKIFEVICQFSEERRIKLILYFCKRNRDYEIFKSINLLPFHYSITGSEVPYIEKKISFLIKLKENLKETDFLEHSIYINEQIQFLVERKENVLIREFMEID